MGVLILFAALASNPTAPANPPQHDESLTINTVPHAERLRWSAEVVLFLTAHESEPGVYRVTGTSWGAFRVLDGQVVAMTREVARIRGIKLKD